MSDSRHELATTLLDEKYSQNAMLATTTAEHKRLCHNVKLHLETEKKKPLSFYE